jgi:putative transposase
MASHSSSSQPISWHLREGRWSEKYACYAITKCVMNRLPLLADPQVADIIFASLKYLLATSEIKVLAFCIMPDHYHLLIFLLSEKTLSDVLGRMGSFTARKANAHYHQHGPFWQEGFHDHRCRDEDDIDERMIYIEHNPVRAGLVNSAEQWPYSSANPSLSGILDRDWYAKMR